MGEGSDAEANPAERGSADRRSINPVAFNELFFDPVANHRQICLGLQLIVRGVSRRFHFNCAADREDAQSEGLLDAMMNIGKCDPTRGSAFAFWTRAAFNFFSTRHRKFKARDTQTISLEYLEV